MDVSQAAAADGVAGGRSEPTFTALQLVDLSGCRLTVLEILCVRTPASLFRPSILGFAPWTTAGHEYG